MDDVVRSGTTESAPGSNPSDERIRALYRSADAWVRANSAAITMAYESMQGHRRRSLLMMAEWLRAGAAGDEYLAASREAHALAQQCRAALLSALAVRRSVRDLGRARRQRGRS